MAPRHLRGDLVTESVRCDARGFQRGHQLGAFDVVLVGHALDFVVDFLGGRLEVEILLLFLNVADFLHLQMLVHEVSQRLLLHFGDVLVGGLHAGGDHQEQHPLAQVIGGDHFVIDHRSHAFPELPANRLRRRRRTRVSCLSARGGGQGHCGGDAEDQIAGQTHENRRPIRRRAESGYRDPSREFLAAGLPSVPPNVVSVRRKAIELEGPIVAL